MIIWRRGGADPQSRARTGGCVGCVPIPVGCLGLLLITIALALLISYVAR